MSMTFTKDADVVVIRNPEFGNIHRVDPGAGHRSVYLLHQLHHKEYRILVQHTG